MAKVAGRRACRRKSQWQLRTEAPPLLDAQGDRIRYARVTAGLSQDQLAAGLRAQTGSRMTKSLISHWERGAVKNPVGANMVVIAHLTGYAYEWLINGGPVPVEVPDTSARDLMLDHVHVTPAGMVWLATKIRASARR